MFNILLSIVKYSFVALIVLIWSIFIFGMMTGLVQYLMKSVS